jgi:uncharacterized tellurite resistance protein B-like protein
LVSKVIFQAENKWNFPIWRINHYIPEKFITMETEGTILSGNSDAEKGAYLAAIASIATADTEASEVEVEHLTALCEAAELSPEQTEKVLAAATSADEQVLLQNLDVLKSSELKFSLVTDLFAFAKSDGNYSEEEQHSVAKISNYLGIDQTQFGLLGEVADKTNQAVSQGEEAQTQGFQSAFGMGDKLKASGINSGGLLKGLISMAAPFIIGRMMSGNRGRSSSGGGILGQLGGMLGGGGGGLGSLIGMLNGGKGMGGIGSMLGKIFK